MRYALIQRKENNMSELDNMNNEEGYTPELIDLED